MNTKTANWTSVQLGNHVDIITGFPFKSAKYTEDTNDMRLIRGDNVAQGYIRWDGVKKWNLQDGEDYSKYELQLDDVILAMDRPWIEAGLKYAWITSQDIPSLLVQRVARLRGVNGLETNYLRYIIASPSFTDYIKPIVTGVAVPHISGDQIKSYKFELPPLPIQRRIADILSAYDDLIENNTRRIHILEQMAQAIYQEWFGKVDKESLPKGWKTGKLSDLVSLIRRTTNAGKHLENLPYVPIDIIPRHSLALTESKPDSEAQSSLILFNKDDVLFGAMRSYFHKVIVAPFDGVTRQTCFVLRPKSPDYYSFAGMTVFQDSTVAYSHAHARGSTMPYAVWDGSFADMPIVVPPQNKANEFNEIVKPMLETIQLSYFRQNNLRQTRDLLLPRLVSGDIDVSSLS